MYACLSVHWHSSLAASAMLTYCAVRLGADIDLGQYQHPAFCRDIQTVSYSMTLAITTIATLLIGYKAWFVYSTCLLHNAPSDCCQDLSNKSPWSHRHIKTRSDTKGYGPAHWIRATIHAFLRTWYILPINNSVELGSRSSFFSSSKAPSQWMPKLKHTRDWHLEWQSYDMLIVLLW